MIPLSTTNRWFFLILFLAIFVRLYDISSENLWADENHSLKTARLAPVSLIEASARDNHPPVYTLFLHYWIKCAADSERALRFPSVLFSLGSIFILYLIAKNVSDHPTALYAVSLCAVSYFQVHYAQEVRSYALALFLALLSIYMMLLLIKRMNTLRTIVYLISSILLVYTHYLGLFVLFAQQIFIGYLWYYKKEKNIRIGRFLVLHILIIFLYLPWINTFLLRALDLRREFWVTAPDIYTIPKTLLVYAGTYSPFGILALFLMLAVVVYALFFVKWDTKSDITVFSLIFFCVPILAPLLISIFWSPLYIIRLTIVSSVFLYLLVGLAVRHIHHSLLRNAVFVLLLACSVANLFIYYNETNKEQWQEAANYIEKNATSADLLLFHAHFGQNGFTYYSDRPDLRSVPVPLYGLDISESDLNDLNSLIRFHKQIWLILTHARDGEKLVNFLNSELEQQEFKEYISYGINSHKPYTGIAVYRYLQKIH